MTKLNSLAPLGQQKPQKMISLLGGAELLSEDGRLITVEELSGNYLDANYRVAFSAPHGRVKFKMLRNLHPSERIVSSVTKLYLSDGQEVVATEFDYYETAEGDLVQLHELTESDSLKVLYYDSRTKFLSAGIAEIDLITENPLPEGPEFLYNAAFSSDNCYPLLSTQIDNNVVACLSYSCSVLSQKKGTSVAS